MKNQKKLYLAFILVMAVIFSVYQPVFARKIINSTYNDTRGYEKNEIVISNIQPLGIKQGNMHFRALLINNTKQLLRRNKYSVSFSVITQSGIKEFSKCFPKTTFFPFRQKQIDLFFNLKNVEKISVLKNSNYFMNVKTSKKYISPPINLKCGMIIFETIKEYIKKKNFDNLTSLLARYKGFSNARKKVLKKHFKPFRSDFLKLIDDFGGTKKSVLSKKLLFVIDSSVSNKNNKVNEKNKRSLKKIKKSKLKIEQLARKIKMKRKPCKADVKLKAVKIDKPDEVSPIIKVKWGDSLYSLAKKYYGKGTDYFLIARLNNLQRPFIIRPGQKLKIFSETQYKKMGKSSPNKIVANKIVPKLETTEKQDEKFVQKVLSLKKNKIAMIKTAVKTPLVNKKVHKSEEIKADILNVEHKITEAKESIKKIEVIEDLEVIEVEINSIKNVKNIVETDNKIDIKKPIVIAKEDSAIQMVPKKVDHQICLTSEKTVVLADKIKKKVVSEVATPLALTPESSSEELPQTTEAVAVVKPGPDNKNADRNRYLMIIIMMLLLLLLVVFFNYVRKLRRGYQIKNERSRFYDENMTTRF